MESFDFNIFSKGFSMGMDLFHQGGFIMYPLLVFSVLAWSIGLYKMYTLWAFTKEYKKVNADVHQVIKSNRLNEMNDTFKNANPFIARTHEILLDQTHTSKEEMNERLSRRLVETNGELKTSLWILGSISSSAPFIGLFGTVLGIMGSFKAIGTTGKSGFSVVAAGISESLVATASGIIVAVVALLFYNYLQTRVNHIATDFRLKMEEVADILFTKRSQGK